MAKKKVTRKQLLKEPDEFITTTGKAIAWSKENSKALTIGATAFFVLIIGLSLYGYFKQKRSADAQMMLSQAVTKYQSQVQSQDGAKALSDVSEDFDTLIESYPNAPAGRLARIIYGHISAVAKDYDNAAEHYRKALVDFGDDASLSNIIHNGLGLAYQQKGEYPNAIQHYQKVAQGPASALKDAAFFNLGKLYHQLGETEKSRNAYQQLSDDFPDSMYADIAKEKN